MEVIVSVNVQQTFFVLGTIALLVNIATAIGSLSMLTLTSFKIENIFSEVIFLGGCAVWVLLFSIYILIPI